MGNFHSQRWSCPLLLAAATSNWERPLPWSVNKPVLQEPTEREFFSFQRSDGATQVTRVANLEDSRFNQLVRDGVPFVVDDCTRDFDEEAVTHLQCKDFAERWPSGNMRAEYTRGQYHIYLKDPNWYTKVETQPGHAEHMADTLAGPYVWHVKDEEPLTTKRAIQKHWRTPYFLEPSLANRVEANESFEFWFSLPGGGTKSHADSYCESTISLQFSGKKRWRIQAFPEVRHFLNATAFGDGEIYGGKTHATWTPETEFVVGPGECFVFPTGYLHESYVDPADNVDTCHTASTFQFNHPRQVNLYRSFLSRFSMSHYGMQEPCLAGQVGHYATLLGEATLPPESLERAAAMTVAEKLVHVVDQDSDLRISLSEMYAFCSHTDRRQKTLNMGGFRYHWFPLLTKNERKQANQEALHVWAEDAVQYHDLDRDGVVTAAELAHGVLQWHVVQHRVRYVEHVVNDERLNDSDFLQKLIQGESRILSKHYCETEPCAEREDLVAYGKFLQSSPRRLRKLRKKLMRMMEAEEGRGDNEELTIVDRESGHRERLTVAEIKQEL